MIRPADPADLCAIRALNLASWNDVYRPLLSADFFGAPIRAYLEARWAVLPDPGLVLVDDGPPLRGFVGVQSGGGARDEPDLPMAYIRAFHVDPALRGQGIGRALFQALTDRLRTAGADGVWLDVAVANAGARAAYARLGGVEGAPFADDIAGHPVTGLRVVWRWPGGSDNSV